ncbi:TIGR03564 family F420-dependent LLM class oxidoreductase [Actinopolymorpha alba]|uniref:TIGR03564 family F420-dependent LLM class oxidoreductase n=1 Tax=Actinopolymorpha alba TaxID=533267 RepID=UPI000368D2E3|nr:TIGR03564 family F420-dependent LLM class oxidoreductase [Actinopolymorpha alba]
MSVDAIVEAARAAGKAGFDAAWLGQRTSWDALTSLAAVGREVPDIELGTSVVPTYPRHPLMLASQALTVQASSGNRLNLGLGVSHRYIIEDQFGYSFDRPARHLREYLSALAPLLRGERVSYQGETLKAVGAIDAPGATPPSLLIGTLGPAMLRIAGELADGTISIWAGPATLADYIVPTITRAAAEAGRPDPRVVAQSFVCVTSDEAGRRAEVGEQFGAAVDVPAYRAIFDREGAAGPQDTVIAGDETSVVRQIRRLADAGATELLAIPIGPAIEQARTTELLASLAVGRRT